MKRLALVIVIGAALLAFLASLTPAQGDGPYEVATILPPPVMWTATPSHVVYLEEVKR